MTGDLFWDSVLSGFWPLNTLNGFNCFRSPEEKLVRSSYVNHALIQSTVLLFEPLSLVLPFTSHTVTLQSVKAQCNSLTLTVGDPVKRTMMFIVRSLKHSLHHKDQI